jgi:hypothetical protein
MHVLGAAVLSCLICCNPAFASESLYVNEPVANDGGLNRAAESLSANAGGRAMREAPGVKLPQLHRLSQITTRSTWHHEVCLIGRARGRFVPGETIKQNNC